MNKMIDWSDIATDPKGELTERLWGRLAEIHAVLTAIGEGELLSEVPPAPDARVRHAAAIGLLALMERDLRGLMTELQLQG